MNVGSVPDIVIHDPQPGQFIPQGKPIQVEIDVLDEVGETINLAVLFGPNPPSCVAVLPAPIIDFECELDPANYPGQQLEIIVGAYDGAVTGNKSIFVDIE